MSASAWLYTDVLKIMEEEGLFVMQADPPYGGAAPDGAAPDGGSPIEAELPGDTGNNTLDGTTGADTILGHGGDDTLRGLAGNDWINGGAGNDFILGDDLDVWGAGGADVLYGGAGSDFLGGGLGDDQMFGGSGDDVLMNGVGESFRTATGFSGDSWSIYPTVDGGFDTLDGGEGIDTAIMTFAARSEGVSIDISNPNAVSAVLVGGVARGSLSGVERLFAWGGDGADVFRGGAYNDSFRVQGGDRVYGGGGVDAAVWNIYGDGVITTEVSGANLVIRQAGTVVGRSESIEKTSIWASSAADRLTLGDGDDSLLGNGGADVLDGGGGNDYLRGDSGTDTLLGGAGSDRLAMDSDDDVLDGGADSPSDTPTFTTSNGLSMLRSIGDVVEIGHAEAYTLNLSITGPQRTPLGLDTIRNVESVLAGGDGAKTIVGNGGANFLYLYNWSALSTSSSAYGLGGEDVLLAYHTSNATSHTVLLDGGEGADTVSFFGDRALFRDSVTLLGGDGADLITCFGAATASIDAGAQADRVVVDAAGGETTIRLGAGSDILAVRATEDPVGGARRVLDFQAGAGGDVLEISDWLAATVSTYTPGTNPFRSGHLMAVQEGDAVQILLDRNGGANDAEQLFILNNVRLEDLTAENLDGFTLPIGHAPAAPGTDFNGDGRADLLFRNTATGDLVQWAGASSAAGGFLGGVGVAYDVLKGDLRGDGRTDLIFMNAQGQVLAWEDGDGGRGRLLGDVGARWSIAAVGDFDGDGRSDLLFRNAQTNDLITWSGGEAAQSTYRGTLGAAWAPLAADITGDGRTDLVFQNAQTGDLVVWEGGDAAHGRSLGSVGGRWRLSTAGDFDGDGRADLVFQNRDSGAVAAWGGGEAARGTSLGVAGVGATLLSGDYDGDGRSDLVLRDGDQLSLWNHGLQSAATGLGSLGAQWEVYGGYGDLEPATGRLMGAALEQPGPAPEAGPDASLGAASAGAASQGGGAVHGDLWLL